MAAKLRVLITGGSGLLALNWVVALRDRYDFVLGTHRRCVSLNNVFSCKIDLNTVKNIELFFERWKPDIVVHAAGLTSVEECELNKELAHYVNVTLAENVARACCVYGLPLIHISTDHLFSGEREFAEERDLVHPVNIYGKTKALAEETILDTYEEALVLRTNFYGFGPTYRQSFSDLIINSIRAGAPLRLFTDIHYNPIIVSELAQVAHELLDLKASGIFHLGGADRLSKYDFGLKVAKFFNLDTTLIQPALFSDEQNFTQRPLDMSLSTTKACNTIGRSLGGVDDHLALLVSQEQMMQEVIQQV